VPFIDRGMFHNGPFLQWRHNIKMAAIVGGLCTEWYRERWCLAMITFIYCSKGEVEVYILTRQMHTVLRPYQNLNLVLPGWIILGHITLTGLLYLHDSMLWKPQNYSKKFILVTMDQCMMKSPTKAATLSIMMSLQIRSIMFMCVSSYFWLTPLSWVSHLL